MEKQFIYERRKPESSVLYQTVRDYLDEFLMAAKSDGKGLPNYVEEEFRDFLRCGCIQFGFIRRKCDDCGKEEWTAFSCKRLGFCPTCCGRRMAESAIHLIDNVLPERAMRQWVISLPFPLRYVLSTNKEIQNKIHNIVINEVHNYYIEKARRHGIKDAKAGSITFIQRWGSALNLNPHFHFIVIDGALFLNSLGEITFKNIDDPSNKEIADILEKIRDKSIKYLRQQGLINNDPDYVILPEDPLFEESPHFAAAKKASVIGRIALGERCGQKVRFIGKGYGYEDKKAVFSGKYCATMNGFSLHCATRIGGA